MNSRATSGSTANSNAPSALRPRNRRLISTELLGGDDLGANSSLIYGNRDGGRERGASPIPSSHPSRVTTGSGLGSAVGSERVGSNTGSTRGKGIWDGGWTGSWTALQGLASSVLGGEIEGSDTTTSGGLAKGRKITAKSKKQTPSTWGPSGSLPIPSKDRIAAGSLEERDRAVKAMRTASVLESHERVNGGLDIRGHHKRRVSMDLPAHDEADEEVMVYVHPVQPTDTVTGVVLKYNCQAAAFRKANRLWPNDVIQIRKEVLLPVDACSVRGRTCDPPEEGKGIDLLAPTPSAEEPPSSSGYMNGGSWNFQSGAAASPFDPLPHEKPAKQEEEPLLWTHVRWVLIDSSPNAKPVRIARIKTRDLGYFPPRRRKSQATLASPLSTPRGSFDQPPSSLSNSHPASSPAGSIRRSSNLSARPSVTSYFPTLASSDPSQPSTTSASTTRPVSRTRRDSFTAADTHLSAWMRGPGGVGTLGKNVRKPGPAQDGLNSWAAKHWPGLAIDYLPSKSILGGETAHWGIEPIEEEDGRRAFGGALGISGGSGTATPTDSRQGMGLENAAAAIEGWVRRLAVRGPGTPRLGPSRSGGPVTDGMGDLIELLDGTGSDDGRGFEPNPEAVAAAAAAAQGGSAGSGGSGRDDLLGSLRGRSKGGKGD